MGHKRCPVKVNRTTADWGMGSWLLFSGVLVCVCVWCVSGGRLYSLASQRTQEPPAAASKCWNYGLYLYTQLLVEPFQKTHLLVKTIWVSTYSFVCFKQTHCFAKVSPCELKKRGSLQKPHIVYSSTLKRWFIKKLGKWMERGIQLMALACSVTCETRN